jgi:electron transfer flavoprotein alpha/beta subunit
VSGNLRVAAIVEQVWDPASIELDAELGDVDWSRAVSVPGPGSLEAVELGLRLGDVTACGIGAGADPVLRRALAMGAAAVRAPDQASLAALLAERAFDLVLAPWRSGHQGPNPLAPLLAGLLDLAQATAVDAIEIDEAGRRATLRRRLDRGEREELVLPLPAVVALEPGLVRPRTASPAAAIAALERDIPVAPPAPRPAREPIFLGYQPPRPPPPRTRPPDASLPAEARIAAILAAPHGDRPRELATGAPEELAERALRFLDERGFSSGPDSPPASDPRREPGSRPEPASPSEPG